MSKCCHPSPCHSQHPGSSCGPEWLLPRVIASSREHLRCFETTLSLPMCANIAHIRGIEAGPEAPEVRSDPCGCKLVIPIIVCAVACDGSVKQICTTLEIPCREPGGKCSGSSLFAQACVRLIEAGCPCDNQVKVFVEVWADLYRIRLEPCRRSGSSDHSSSQCCPSAFHNLPWFPTPRF